MKRLAFLFAATMLAATAPQPANAQHTVVRNRTRVTITNPEGERVVVRSDDDNRITLRVASVEIGLDDEGNVRTSAAAPPRRKAVAFGDSDFQSFFELGINTLPRPDYSLYGTLPDELYDFMDLRRDALPQPQPHPLLHHRPSARVQRIRLFTIRPAHQKERDARTGSPPGGL